MSTELFNPEAEAAVLGDVLINPSMRAELNLAAGDFYFQRHQMIWTAAGQVQAAGLLLDFVTLSEQLRQNGNLEEIGGGSFLVGLMNATPLSTNAESHAAIVRDLARRRQIVNIAQSLVSAAHDADASVMDAQSQALDDLGKTAKTDGGAVHINEWAIETFSAIADRMTNGAPDLIPTGFADLDHVIGGLDPDEGTMLFLGGQPGAGKTILFSNIAENMQATAPGALYSLEMKRKRMMMRSFSAASNISAWRMRRGEINADEYGKLGEALARYENMQLYASDVPTWTTSGLRADLIRLKYEKGIKWYGVDYMGLLADETGRGVKDHERLAHLSRRLLRINRDLGLASIIIHTTTKDNFGSGQTYGGGFAGSAGVQYDFDIGAVLKTPADFVPDGRDEWEPRTLTFTKNRDGELALGDLDLLKHSRTPRFKSGARESTMVYLNGS